MKLRGRELLRILWRYAKYLPVVAGYTIVFALFAVFLVGLGVSVWVTMPLIVFIVVACLAALPTWLWMRGRPWWRQLGLALLIWIPGMFLVGWVREWRAESFLAELRREGIKTTLADFAEDVQERDNAAAPLKDWTQKNKGPKYTEFHDALKKIEGEFPYHKWVNGTQTILNNVISRNRSYLDGVEKDVVQILVSRKRFYPEDLSAKARNPLVYHIYRYAGLVSVARALRVLAYRHAMRGDMRGAWREVEMQFRLGRLVSQGPDLIATMIAVATVGIATRTGMSLLANTSGAVVPSATTREMESLLEATFVVNAMAMELAFSCDVRKIIARDVEASLLNPLSWILGLGFVPFFDADREASWRVDYLPVIRTRDWVSFNHMWMNAPSGFLRSWRLGFYPHFRRETIRSLWQKELEAQTRVQFLMICSAIRAYRLRHGRLPEKLSVLAPDFIAAEHLVDRFTGKSLGFELWKKSGGYKVFSMGAKGDRMDSRDDTFELTVPRRSKR